jgi:hypothetical protein
MESAPYSARLALLNKRQTTAFKSR